MRISYLGIQVTKIPVKRIDDDEKIIGWEELFELIGVGEKSDFKWENDQ